MLKDLDGKPEARETDLGKRKRSGEKDRSTDVMSKRISPITFVKMLAQQREAVERERISRYIETESSDPNSVLNTFPRDFAYTNQAPDVYQWLRENIPEDDRNGLVFYLRAVLRKMPDEVKGKTGRFWVDVVKSIEYVEAEPWTSQFLQDDFDSGFMIYLSEDVSGFRLNAFDLLAATIGRIDSNKHLYTSRSIEMIPQELWALGKLVGRSGEEITAETLERNYIGPARYVMRKRVL